MTTRRHEHCSGTRQRRNATTAHDHGQDTAQIGDGTAPLRYLRRRRQVAVDLVDLLHEALVQHLVRLVDDEHLDVARVQVSATQHVRDAAGGTADHVHAALHARHGMAYTGVVITAPRLAGSKRRARTSSRRMSSPIDLPPMHA
jgi:hypothetical protein